MDRKKALQLLGATIALLALGATVASFDGAALAAQLPHLEPTLPALGVAASTLAYWALRALRWRTLLEPHQHSIPYSRLYLITAISLGLALITPAGLGEALKIELNRQLAPLGRAQGYSLLAVERALDLTLLLAFAAAAIMQDASLHHLQNPLLAIAALLLLATLGAAAIRRWTPRTLQSALGDLRLPPPRNLLHAALLTLAGWTAAASAWHCALLAARLHLEPLQLAYLVALVTLAGLLSLAPGSLGVAELSTAWLLQRWGCTLQAAQLGALLLRAMSLLMIALSLLHLPLWRRLLNHTTPTERPHEPR
jgi:uncharacterized membrane protein YbhN (UPF0104 family)